MNTVIKTLCLTLSLCSASAYASEQLNEHKVSASPRSSLRPHIGNQVESRESLGTVDPEDFHGNDLVALHRLQPGDEGYLDAQERAYLKNNALQKAVVIFGVNQFHAEPFEEPKFVRAPYAKPSYLKQVARLCCCCK